MLDAVQEGKELVFYPQYCFHDQRVYHAEELLSFSKCDFKVREITINPRVGFSEVCQTDNDHQYTPRWKVDTKDWSKLFGDDSVIFRFDESGKIPETPVVEYYCQQDMFTTDFKCVNVRKGSKEGEILFSVTKKFFSMDQYWKIWKGGKGSKGDKDYDYSFRSNTMEDQRLMKNKDGQLVALWYTDKLQATTSFRFTVAPGFDTSFALAVMVCSRVMDMKK